jgi:hypothetical protein
MASSDARRQRRAFKKYVAKNSKRILAEYFAQQNREKTYSIDIPMGEEAMEEMDNVLKEYIDQEHEVKS